MADAGAEEVTVAVEETPTGTREVTASVPAGGAGPATVTEVVTTEPAEEDDAVADAAEQVATAVANAVAGDPDAVVTEVEAVAPMDADLAEQPAVVTEVTETVVVNDGPATTTTTVATTDADGDTVVTETVETEAEPALANAAAADATAAPAAAPASSAAPAAAVTAGGEPDFMTLPPHGCEIFIGGLPLPATDEQVTEFASTIGEVHSCTALKDPAMPSQNRGFGFITYKEKEHAQRALQELHQTELKDFPGFKVRLAPSQSKNKLYIGNVPKVWSKERWDEELNKHVRGVTETELLMSKDFDGQNRGFGFAIFYNHAAANHAKKVLSAPNFKMGERTLNIAFAEPKNSELAATGQTLQPAKVYVGGLPEGTTDTKLQAFFSEYGEVVRVTIPPPKDGKPRDYAFVEFQDAQIASSIVDGCEKGQKPSLDGYSLEVKPAKPQVNTQHAGYGGAPYGGGYNAPYGGRGGYGGQRGGRGGGYGGYDQRYGQGYGGGYGGGGGGYGQQGGYGQPYQQYGGPGMQMVPMMMPNGSVGYVLQQQPGMDQGYGAAPQRDSGNYRYRPY